MAFNAGKIFVLIRALRGRHAVHRRVFLNGIVDALRVEPGFDVPALPGP